MKYINGFIFAAALCGSLHSWCQFNGKPIFSGSPAKLDTRHNRVGIAPSDTCSVQTSDQGELQVTCEPSKRAFPRVSFKVGLATHKPWLAYTNYIGSIVGPTIPGKKVVRRTIYCDGSFCEHAG